MISKKNKLSEDIRKEGRQLSKPNSDSNPFKRCTHQPDPLVNSSKLSKLQPNSI